MDQETSSDAANLSRNVESGNQPVQPAGGRKLLFRLGALLIAGVGLMVIGLPTILATSGLYRGLLDRAAEGREISVASESAMLGWFAPVVLREAEVKRDDRSWRVSTKTFSTRKTLLEFVFSPADIGTITLERPIAIVQLKSDRDSNDPDDTSPEARKNWPELRVVVQDGLVQVETPASADPVISIDGISLTGQTKIQNETSILIVDPVTLFDRRELTPELCDQGLQLVAPVLSEAATVGGELSMQLDEFQIPVGTVTQDERLALTKISGQMTLHRVETGLKNPILAAVTSVLSQLNGRRFEAVQVVEDSRIRFRVESGRVYHDGLTLLIPELASDLTIQTNGWVDLEENIDVQIIVNVSALASSRIEMLTSLMQSPLEIRMTGTLRNPRISLPTGRNMLDQLTGRLDELTGVDLQSGQIDNPGLAGAITDLVDGVLSEKDSKPDVGKTTRGIFNLIQSLQNDRNDDQSRD